MPYNPNIPRTTDVPANSRPEIQQNFALIKQLIDVNHVTFGAAGQGKHQKVAVPISAAAPATAANEIMLYSKTVSGHTQLFYRRDNVATERALTSTGNNWCMLPNGLLMKWGEAHGTGLVTVALGGAALGGNYATRIFASVTPSWKAGSSVNMFAYPEIGATPGTEPNSLRVHCINRTTGANLAVWFSWLTIGTI
jgi:hypothetical protein